MTQEPTHRCEDCGADVPVVPMSAYEFDYRCGCGYWGTVSWSHASAPPTFHGQAVQLELSL